MKSPKPIFRFIFFLEIISDPRIADGRQETIKAIESVKKLFALPDNPNISIATIPGNSKVRYAGDFDNTFNNKRIIAKTRIPIDAPTKDRASLIKFDLVVASLLSWLTNSLFIILYCL